jgi:hypothetical protein
MPEHFTQTDYSLLNLRKEERAGHAPRVFCFINRRISPLFPSGICVKMRTSSAKWICHPTIHTPGRTHLATYRYKSTSPRRMLSSIFFIFLGFFQSFPALPAIFFVTRVFTDCYRHPPQKTIFNFPSENLWPARGMAGHPGLSQPDSNRRQRRRLPTGRQRPTC